MGRKSSNVPLTQEELDAPSSGFTVAPQSRVAGSTILNELLKHVTDGTYYYIVTAKNMLGKALSDRGFIQVFK